MRSAFAIMLLGVTLGACGGGSGAPLDATGSDDGSAGTCDPSDVSMGTEMDGFIVGVDVLEVGQVYVVHSHLSRPGTLGSCITNNSNIYVIRGVQTDGSTEVWIFGSGYGDPGGDVPQYKTIASGDSARTRGIPNV